jgi:hypothetical protein
MLSFMRMRPQGLTRVSAPLSAAQMVVALADPPPRAPRTAQARSQVVPAPYGGVEQRGVRIP